MTDRRLAGVISDVSLLDLTPLSSADELAAITRISDVAIMLVPESLMPAVAGIPMDDVAMVVPVPDGVEVRGHTGALVMGGEALAAPEAENAALIVTGTLILTSPVQKVAYRQVIVLGLVLAPPGSESALGAGLTRVTGSVDYYPYAEGQEVKVSTGQFRPTGSPRQPDRRSRRRPRGGRPADRDRASGQGRVPARRGRRAGGRPPGQPGVLGPAIAVKGQLVWYSGHPRFFVGKDRFGRSFFELIDQQLTIALVGRSRSTPTCPRSCCGTRSRRSSWSASWSRPAGSSGSCSS